MESAMALTNRLLSSAQALAAVTAHLRAEAEGQSIDPELRTAIERVVDELGVRPALSELSPGERSVVVAFARSYLRQALELADEPFRPNAWSHSDATTLQAQGAASGMVARLIHGAGLGWPSMRVLDVGTGVAGLAMALCELFPDATVVGVDPWRPALELARANVERAGLQDRITLHELGVEDFLDPDGFDLIWFPSFFIPKRILDAALRRCLDLLRDRGTLVVGVIESPGDPLTRAVDAMITIRSGGSVLDAREVEARLVSAGFDDVAEVPRTWRAPLRLIAGRKSGGA